MEYSIIPDSVFNCFCEAYTVIECELGDCIYCVTCTCFHKIILFPGNEPLAENLAKSDQPPDDGDVPPSGEAAIQESNNSPVNPPHYQGVLDGFASGGNTRFTSLQLSPYLYGEGTKEQLLPVKQVMGSN